MRDVRFLTVLQASDKDKPQTPPLVDAGAGFAATMARDVVVVFPHDLGAEVSELSLAPPPGAHTLLVTGLQPNGEYALAREGAKVHLRRGKGAHADAGGVLWQPLP